MWGLNSFRGGHIYMTCIGHGHLEFIILPLYYHPSSSLYLTGHTHMSPLGFSKAVFSITPGYWTIFSCVPTEFAHVLKNGWKRDFVLHSMKALFVNHMVIQQTQYTGSLVPRPHPSLCCLQYCKWQKWGGLGNKATDQRLWINNQLPIRLGMTELTQRKSCNGREGVDIYSSVNITRHSDLLQHSLWSVLTMEFRKTGKAWYQRSCEYHVNIRWVLNDVVSRWTLYRQVDWQK